MDGGEDARLNDDDLTADEVRAAIGALTDQDWRILYLVERRYGAGTDFAEGDLLQEALCLAFERRRRCPRDVGFVRTLSLMMRSAGFHLRKAMSRQVGFDAPVVAGKDGGMLAPADTLQAPGMSPETAIMEKERPNIAAAALSIFSDDEDVQYVILGIVEGLKGAALQSLPRPWLCQRRHLQPQAGS